MEDPAAPYKALVVILATLLLVAVGIIFYLVDQNRSAATPSADVPRPAIPGLTGIGPTNTPVPAITTLDKQYTFPINSSGVKVGEINFIIKSVERTKEVMIAGQKATAVRGRELVIVNAELTNSGNLGVMVNTRNYLRLTVNNQDKLLAPEYHPDPLDLQPQSTKDIRLGFSIAETDENLVLQVGELQGPKDVIKLD
jgi:hypothetical protein